ncbi:MAG: phage integrase SAM-like domain-containing protein [Tannerellaceae bacterium]
MARKKTEAKPKEPIKIRFRKCADGNQSIYLDYYTGDVVRNGTEDTVKVGGKHKYEYLKLYIVPENTKEDRQKNTTTLSLAKAIQSKRIVELQNDAHGFQNGNKSKANIIDYIETMREQAKERASLNYWATMGNVVRVLKLYRGDYIAFKDVDKDFLKGFVDFLT